MPNWSSNSQTQMPSSPSSAGTPESEKSQQPRPSAIMPSILTRMGSERARPKATSLSTRSSGASGAPRPTPFSSTTPSSRLANLRPLCGLGGTHEGARRGDPTEGVALLLVVQTVYRLGLVDVGHLHRRSLEARLFQDAHVLLGLQRPGHTPRPRGHGVPHRCRQLLLAAEEDNVRDGEPATRLQHPERFRDHPWLVRGEIDHAV